MLTTHDLTWLPRKRSVSTIVSLNEQAEGLKLLFIHVDSHHQSLFVILRNQERTRSRRERHVMVDDSPKNFASFASESR